VVDETRVVTRLVAQLVLARRTATTWSNSSRWSSASFGPALPGRSIAASGSPSCRTGADRGKPYPFL